MHLKQLKATRDLLQLQPVLIGFSVWVMHESALRLNLFMPKLYAKEMYSTCVFIIMLCLPIYNFEKGSGLWVNENLTHNPG